MGFMPASSDANSVTKYEVQDPMTGKTSWSVNAPGTVQDPVAAQQNVYTGKTKTGSASVICSEIYRRGDMPEHIREADERVGVAQSAEVMAGYHLWGIPLVRAMQRHELLYKVVKTPALHWAYYMAYKQGVTTKNDYVGATLHHIGLPICYGIGLIVRTVKVSATQKV